jgi:hypothetical protein
MKECALILTRSNNSYVDYLSKNLELDSYIISDTDISDESAISRNFINATSKKLKNPNSWDKSFLFIQDNSLLNKYDNIWFLEDDVYSRNIKIINSFISKVSKENYDLCYYKHWYFNTAPIWVKDTIFLKDFVQNGFYQSYNQFSRLSNRLVNQIFNIHQSYNSLFFHEYMFPNLARYQGYKILQFVDQIQYRNFFGKFYCGRSIPKQNIQTDKIYHPVKDR